MGSRISKDQEDIVATPLTNKELDIGIYKLISDYIKKKDTTLLQFAIALDIDKTDNINSVAFENFFKDEDSKPAFKVVKVLFEALDPEGTGRITRKKFIDVVGQNIKEISRTTKKVDKSPKTLGNYIVENKMDVAKFFKRLDTDSAGFMEVKELKAELSRIGYLTSDIEMNSLLSLSGDSKDAMVNVDKLRDEILSYIKAANKLKVSNPWDDTLNELKNKCFKVVVKHYDSLFTGFELMGLITRSQQCLISKENFQKVFEVNNTELTSSEVDLILDYLVTLHSDGYVFYDKFLKDFNQRDSSTWFEMILGSAH